MSRIVISGASGERPRSLREVFEYCKGQRYDEL